MTLCVNCEKSLVGRQTKYCSRSCKNSVGNRRNQSYKAQQARGRKRKKALVDRFGSRCQKCGYDRNLAALEFHHTEAEDKQFQLDLRSLSNRTWQSVLCEARKCVLVCSNCHKEIHNPTMMLS